MCGSVHLLSRDTSIKLHKFILKEKVLSLWKEALLKHLSISGSSSLIFHEVNPLQPFLLFLEKVEQIQVFQTLMT